MKKTALLLSVVTILIVGCGEEKSTTKTSAQNREVKQVKTESIKKEETVVKTKVESIKKDKEVKKVENKPQTKEEQPVKKEIKASSSKGQKIFARKLKKVCGMNGGEFAKKHTQDEWSKIEKEGKFKSEIKSICKDVDLSQLKDKYLPDLFEFVHQFASDSGNIPSC